MPDLQKDWEDAKPVSQADWDAAAPVSAELLSEWEAADPNKKATIYSKAKMYYNRYGKPMLEMGGLTAGGVIGAAAGAPTGPGAAVTAVAGAGLGYGIGKKLGEVGEDLFDYFGKGEVKSRPVGQEMVQSAKDVATGMAYQMGGEVAGKYVFEPAMKAGKWVFRLAKGMLTKTPTKETMAKAAKVWFAQTSEGPIYVRNAEEATKLEKEIPGLKFTYGQKTYDQRFIPFERATIRKGGDAAQLNAEQIAGNDEALKAYYQKNFGSSEGVDDLLSALQGKREAIAGQVEGAKGTAVQIESRLAGAQEPTKLSEALVSKLKTEKVHVRESVSRLYDKIPNVDVGIEDMVSQMQAIAKPTSPVEGSENFPKVLRRILKEYGPKEMPEELSNIVQSYQKAGRELPEEVAAMVKEYAGGGGKIPFQDLRGMRSEILTATRVEAFKQNPNPAKLKRLHDMQSSVEEAINKLGQEGQYPQEIVDAYRFASSQWKKYADTYKRGAVGNILQRGARYETSKMAPEEMLGKIFNNRDTQAADQLIAAIGKEDSAKLVNEYANYDLMKRTYDPMKGEVNRGRFMAWYHRNKNILSKYGLEGNYKNLEQAKAMVDDAIKNQKVFESSQAAKMLGVDPEKAIGIAFSGKGSANSAQTAKDLMGMVEGDPAAVEGLRNGFAKFAVEKARLTAKDIVGNPTASVAKFDALYQKLAPAMRILYAKDPAKMKALMNMKKAYEIMIRNQRSPFGGGSDTAENISQMLATMIAPAVTGRYTVINAVRTAGRLINQFGQKQMQKVMTRALFDGDFAETLMGIGAQGTVAKNAENRLARQLIALGAREGTEAMQQTEEQPQ